MRSRRSSLEFRKVVTPARLISLVCVLGLVSTLPLLGRAPQSDMSQKSAVGSRIWLRDAQPIVVKHVGAAKTVQASSLVPDSIILVSGSETAHVTINLAVPKGASKGTSTITITGTGGGLTHTATAILKVGLN